MSTYISPSKNLDIAALDAPPYVRDYLNYLSVIQNQSEYTIRSYYIQLRMFLRYIKCRIDGGEISRERLDSTTIADIPFEIIEQISVEDIYDFLAFAGSELKNESETRHLKLSALRSFYSYLVKVARKLPSDITRDVVAPKLNKTVPRYLSLDESYRLLDSIDEDAQHAKRDYCILLLLLSCGMRVSELVKLDLNDIQDDKLRLRGKGGKERYVYLNDSSINALADYLKERLSYPTITDKEALFISRNKGARMSVRRVQQIVGAALDKAGLGNKGLSTHKLRHTAATMLYQTGAANVLELKEILGHSSVMTTELYTHVEDEQIRQVMKHSPFSNVSK